MTRRLGPGPLQRRRHGEEISVRAPPTTVCAGCASTTSAGVTQCTITGRTRWPESVHRSIKSSSVFARANPNPAAIGSAVSLRALKREQPRRDNVAGGPTVGNRLRLKPGPILTPDRVVVGRRSYRNLVWVVDLPCASPR